MRTMYVLIGFFGSGKSTWANEFVKENPDTKIVGGDGFRSMLNGEYKYLAELDDIITASMADTIKHLLNGGYNVIVDVGNLTNERRKSWMDIPVDRRVAVLFPQEDKAWHLKNRLKKPHWQEADWDRIYEAEHAAYEPINESDFDDITRMEGWE